LTRAFRSNRTSLLTFAAAIALSACNGPLSQVSAGSAAQQQNAVVARGKSWMSPKAKKQSLLYVSSVLTNDVYVYSYSPVRLVGTLTGFSTPYGLCADKRGAFGSSTMAPRSSSNTPPAARRRSGR
jgi:hypothetical protein